MRPANKMAIVGVAFVAWLLLFVIGGNRPGAEVLAKMENAGLWEILELVPTAIVLWGWSNIAILALLAGIIGEVGKPQTSNVAGGAARGFFVFLLAVGGQLVYAPVFHFPDQQTYFRVAGLTSFVAFSIGWRPDLVSSLTTGVGRLLEDVGARRVSKSSSGNTKGEDSRDD